jgi:ribosomal protein L4
MKDQVAIIKACIRGASWINNPGNWRKYQQILNDKVFPDQPEFNTKELRAMLSFVKIHDKKILFNRNRKEGGTKIYLDNLNTFLQITAKQSFDPADVVDSRALMQALGK